MFLDATAAYQETEVTSPTVELLLLLGVERAPLRASVARFVYWNRLFVFDPDGTLSMPVDFVPFTRDRFAVPRFERMVYFFFFSFFLLLQPLRPIEQLESVHDRSSIEICAESRIKRERGSFSFFSLFFFPSFLTIDRSCTSIGTRARGRDLFKFSDGH